MSTTQQTYISEKVKNSSGIIINPATIEEQQNGNNIEDAIYMLVKSLAFLPSIRDTSAGIRTSITNTPNIGTVTAITALTNQSQIGGYLANPQIPSLMNQTAFNNIRNVIVS